MQRERASIPRVELVGCFSLEKSKIMRSEEEIPRKPFGEFKTINSTLMTKC
jgi:hypothetical protein